MSRCARCAARCSKPMSRSMSCAPSSTQVQTNAVGVALIHSVKPGQMVVKIVHDQLIETLGATPTRSTSTHPRRSPS